MKNTILTIFLILATSICYSKDTTKTVTTDNQTLEKIQDDIKEIRRDQLNYKIEKDLLKETYGSLKDTYSSNYTTVQIIISLILGLFAILGYLGFKGIIGLKKEYDSELVKIKELKATFEAQLKELNDSQERVKGQIASMDNVNAEQNKKIQLLEIKEKVGTWYTQKVYQRALEYIAIGLELAKDDIELLILRAFTLLKMRNYAESIEAHKKVLSLDPTNQGIIVNLAELYLVAEQVENYNTLAREKLEFIKSHTEGLLSYFEAFKNYLDKKPEVLKQIISSFLDKQDPLISKNFLGSWDLEEFLEVINPKPVTPEKTLVTNFANYLKGHMQGQQMRNILNQ